MTRTVSAKALRRSLILSSALCMSMGVLAVPAAAQNTPLGTVTVNGISGETGALNPVIDSGRNRSGGDTMNVTLGARATVLDWNNFTVGKNDVANFINATSTQKIAVLNRITGRNESTFSGKVNGLNSAINPLLPNGGYGVEVWISNPNGIVLGADGAFNTQGLVLTTLAFNQPNADKFKAGGAGNSFRLTSPGAANDPGITGSIGTINTNGRVQAFVAPVIRLTGGTYDAGAGSAAFVVASDVTISNPDSPLGITIERGTAVASALALAGTVTAGQAYAVVSAQDSVNALLGISARVTSATVGGDGVVVLSGVSNANSPGPVDVRDVAGTRGTVDITTTGALTSAGDSSVRLFGNGVTTVAGDVTSGRDFAATGTAILLGTAGQSASQRTSQQAPGQITVTATAGQVLAQGNLTLAADTDGVGGATDLLTLSASGGFALSPATLVSGALSGTANSAIDFRVNGTAPFAVGNVRAGTLLQNGAAGLNRNAAMTFGALTLAGANRIETTGNLGTGAISTAGDLVLRGDSGLAVSGDITNATASMGNVTLRASTGAPSVGIHNTNLAGALLIEAGMGGVGFDNLGGNGAKTITTIGEIRGTGTITGTGAVALATSANQPLGVGGAIGAANGAPTSLAIDGGRVTLGSVRVSGATSWGAATPLDSLVVNGAVSTGSQSVAALGPVQFAGAVTSLVGPTSVASANDSVTFLGTLDGAGALTVGAAGSRGIIFGGAVGGATRFGSLTTLGTTPVSFDSGRVSTTGAQTYGGVVRLNADTVMTGGNVTFSGIDGANGRADHNLTLNFSGVTALDGGALVGLRNLTTDAAGSTTLGGTVTVSGALQFNDAVALASATTLAGAGGVTIAGALTGPQALVVNTGATTRLTGGATGLTSITTDGAGTTVLAGTFSTTGDQNYRDPVQLGGDTVVQNTTGALSFGGQITGPFALTVGSAGTTTLGGALGALRANGSIDTALSPTAFSSTGTGAVVLNGAVITQGAQSYAGPLQLGASAVLTGATGALNGGVVGGGFDLQLNYSGRTVVNGARFSGVRQFGSGGGGTTELSGTLDTADGQNYADDVVIGGDALLQSGGGTGTGAMTFSRTVNGGNSLTVATGGVTTFGGDVGVGQALTSLTITGASVIANAGPRQVVTSGAQSYGGGLSLAGDTALTGTDLTLGGGVNGAVGGADHDLALNFKGATALTGSTLTGIRNLSTDAAGSTALSGVFTTSGTQRFDDAVTLSGATTLRSTGVGAGGAIGFGGGVTGEQALVVNTAGATSFAAGATGLASISTDAGGATVLNGTVATTGAQDYGDDVVLGGDTVARSAGALSFAGTVTGAHALTVDATGPTTFNGAVGSVGTGGKAGAGSPTGLASTGGGVVLVKGGQIITTGAQSYAGAVQLGGDTELAGTTGSFATGIAGNGFDLAINFSSPVVFAGLGVTNVDNLSVGGGVGTKPGGPNTNGPGAPLSTVALAGLISSTGGQTYNGNVVLTGDTALKSGDGTGTGDISFTGTVGGAQSLTVTTAGQTSFAGAVGTAAAPITRLAVDGAGRIAFNGASVTSTGAQSYTGAVTLGGDTALTTNGADIGFGGPVDGPYQLLLQTGIGPVTGGAVTFGGAVGRDAALTALSIRADSATASAGVKVGTIAAQVNTGGFALANGAALTVGTVGTLTGVTAGAGAVALSAAGTLTLGGDVRGDGVSLSGTGITQAAGLMVDGGAGAIGMRGNGGAITLGGSLRTSGDGANAVRIFDASTVALGSVTTGAEGTIRLGLAGADKIAGAVTQTAGVLTAGALTGNVGGAVTLTGANRIGSLGAFTAEGFALTTARALAVDGAVDAGAGDLRLVSGGALMLGGDLIARSGAVTLTAGGRVAQTAGAITARTLAGGSSADDVSLGSAGNAIGTLAGFNSAGAFALTDSVALIVASDLQSSGALTLSATGIDATGRTLAAGGVLTLTGQAGDVAAATLNGRGIAVTGAGVVIGAADAGAGALSLTTTDATRGLVLGGGAAGTTASLTGAGAVTLTAPLTANGELTVVAGDAAQVGDLVSKTGAIAVTGARVTVANATANGALLLRSTTGALSLGGGAAGGAATLASGGTLDLTNSLTSAGDAALTAVSAAKIGTVTSSGGAVLIRGSTATIGTAGAKTMLDVQAAGGDLSLSTAAAGGDASLAASGGVTLGTVGTAAAPVGGKLSIAAANGAVTGDTVAAAGAASVSASGAVKLAVLNGGDIVAVGRSIDVGRATSTGALTMQAGNGTLLLGTGVAGGTANLSAKDTLTVVTKLTSGKTATIVTGGDAQLASVLATSGDIVVTATGQIGGLNGARADLAAPGGTVRLMAGTAVSLGPITADSFSLEAPTIDLVSVVANTLLLNATAGTLTLGSGTVTGAATLTAKTALNVGQLGAGGPATVAAGTTATLDRVNASAVSVTGTSVRVTQATTRDGALLVRSTAGDLSLGSAAVAGPATLDATGGALLVTDTVLASGDIAVTGTGAVTTQALTSTAGAIAVQGGTVKLGNLSSKGDLSLTGLAGDVVLGDADVGGAAAVKAPGAVSLGALTSKGAATLTSGGDLTGTGVVATGGATATAANLLKLGALSGAGVTGTGKTVEVVSTASTGALALNATAGALTLGTGTAAGAATLGASGPVTITTSLTSAGSAAVTSGGAARIAALSSTNGDVGVTAATLAVTNVAAGRALVLQSVGGGLSLGTGSAGGAVTVTAAGPLAITASLAGGGAVQLSSTGTVNTGAVSSGGGAVGVTGTALTIANAKAATTLDLAASAGDLALGAGAAGGAATLRASGAVGSTSLTAGGAAALTAGTTLNSGAVNATGAAALAAMGAATLGATTAGGAVTVTGATVTAGQTSAGTTLTVTSPGAVIVAGGSAGGDASFDSGATIGLGQFLGGAAAAITVKALDADITGTLRAGTVTFTNRAPATTALKLGNGTSTGGFALSATEVNNVEAGQLTLDAGMGNVEVGALAFDADAGRTRVDVLTTGRVDVTGTVTGTGAGRTFRLGGSAANTVDKASAIRVAATSDAGGRLLFDTADLDLRGARIGVGQASGFLDAIGVGSAAGQTPEAVTTAFVGNPNSALYNPAFGGVTYPALSALVTARSLTVRYSDYALFQNTSAPGQNSGVALGTIAGGPTSGSLTVQGPGTGIVNAFALFGTIGGITGTAASVLGPPIVNLTGTDPANTRINGCAAGSGAGCLTAVVTQPLLTIFDTSRVVVVRAGDDLAVPFDPVVGTSNEALFTGLGLLDDAVTPTACAADAVGPGCGAGPEQGPGEKGK